MRADWNLRAVVIVGRMESLGDISKALLVTSMISSLNVSARASPFSHFVICHIIQTNKRLNVAITKLNYCTGIRRLQGIRWPKKKTGFQRISDDAVRARTGKGWEEWFTILDTYGAKEKGHTKSAKYFLEHYALSPWWAQGDTIRYEWKRGLRK